MSTDNPPPVSGEIIRMLRTLKGIKQTEAAKKLGISQQGYSKIESGDVISASKLVEILKAFNCTMQHFEDIIKITPPAALK